MGPEVFFSVYFSSLKTNLTCPTSLRPLPFSPRALTGCFDQCWFIYYVCCCHRVLIAWVVLNMYLESKMLSFTEEGHMGSRDPKYSLSIPRTSLSALGRRAMGNRYLSP